MKKFSIHSKKKKNRLGGNSFLLASGTSVSLMFGLGICCLVREAGQHLFSQVIEREENAMVWLQSQVSNRFVTFL